MSKPRAYFNEIDPFAAEWLRALIAAGHIAPGDVDTRSIVDVRPDDLRGYTQCHFFAGIGVWSYALRLAGWPDDRPVWTMSCPCQPFSAAGKGGGFDDERHLWPHAYWLIGQRRPRVVIGEQVASKDGLAWLDLVQADLEGARYTSGAVDTCSAGVGAPHIRQRLYWVADTDDYEPRPGRNGRAAAGEGFRFEPGRRGAAGSLAHADDDRFQGRPVETVFGEGWREEGHATGRGGAPLADGLADTAISGNGAFHGQPGTGIRQEEPAGGRSVSVGLGDARHAASQRNAGAVSRTEAGEYGAGFAVDGREPVRFEHASAGLDRPASGPTNGLWRDADWLFCRDDKWRPVEPGTFPLAHGASARVGRLRGYGNAINAEAARVFIEAYLETQAIGTDRHIQLTDGDIFA